jgi:hypothetical protein
VVVVETVAVVLTVTAVVVEETKDTITIDINS